ncbi:hypothetical protein ACTA71_004581 [Dictyostelium dimigraforme]
MENYYTPRRIALFFMSQIQKNSDNEPPSLSNPNNEDEENLMQISNFNNKTKKSNSILKRIKMYIMFIIIVVLFLFILISRKQLFKAIEDQQYQFEQLLEIQKQNQKQNQEEQYKNLLNKFEIHQTILEQYETNFKINYFANKVIDIRAIDVNLFFRTDGSVLNLTKFSNEWEKFIIEQSKIPGRYFIKSNHFKTFLFYNNGTNTLSMTQHLMDSECSTFEFIKTNINDHYQIETCLGYLIKSINETIITIKKENSNIAGTNFILNII